MKVGFFLAIIAACALDACMPAQNFAAADALIAKFRALQAKGDYVGIYDLGSPAFKAETTKDVFTEIMTTVTHKTTDCGAPSEINVAFYTGTGGAAITKRFERKCTRGKVIETFVIRTDGDKASLNGYNANSPLLLLPDPSSAAPTPPSASPPRSAAPIAHGTPT